MNGMGWDGVRIQLLNQCTINDYEPGAGIRGHVDTAEAFGDEVYIISLCGHIVMKFTHERTGEYKNVVSRALCFAFLYLLRACALLRLLCA